MVHIWTYFLVVLCTTVTSSKSTDSLGNRNGLYDNLASDVKEESALTPPSDNRLNIDSNDYQPSFPGNPNGNAGTTKTLGVVGKPKQALSCAELCEKGEGGNSCFCHQSLFLKKMLTALLNGNNDLGDYQIVPFDEEDIANLENSELCKTMCNDGIQRPPCKCN